MHGIRDDDMYEKLIILMVVLSMINVAEATYWDSNWLQSQQLKVENKNASTGAPIQKVVFYTNTTALIHQGKMKSDCSDARIVANNISSLSRVIQNCNTGNTSFYFKLNESIPLSSNSTNYTFFYNNSAAGAGDSNWTNVFMPPIDENTSISLWYEEASGLIYDHTLNNNTFNVTGSAQYQKAGPNGFSLKLGTAVSSVIYTDLIVTPNLNRFIPQGQIDIMVNLSAGTTTKYLISMINGSGSVNLYIAAPDNTNKIRFMCDPQTSTMDSANTITKNVWANLTMKWNSTGCYGYVNGNMSVSREYLSGFTNWNTTTKFTIGRYIGGTGFNWVGNIDEFRMSDTDRNTPYLRDRNATEFLPVLTVYNGTETSTATGADTTPPTVTINYPTNGQTVNSAPFLNGTATDAVGVAWIKTNSTIYSGADNTSPFNFTNQSVLAEGTYTINVSANDSAGNVGWANVTFTYTAPTNSCTCPSINTNWAIALSDYCVISSDCNIGSGNITFTGTGNITFNSSVTAKGIGAIPNNQRGYLGNMARVRGG